MKEGTHPTYNQTTITCACGNIIEVGSTKKDLKVDVCSKCHPYWTGNLRKDTVGGRADKFKKKYGLASTLFFLTFRENPIPRKSLIFKFKFSSAMFQTQLISKMVILLRRFTIFLKSIMIETWQKKFKSES